MRRKKSGGMKRRNAAAKRRGSVPLRVVIDLIMTAAAAVTAFHSLSLHSLLQHASTLAYFYLRGPPSPGFRSLAYVHALGSFFVCFDCISALLDWNGLCTNI